MATIIEYGFFFGLIVFVFVVFLVGAAVAAFAYARMMSYAEQRAQSLRNSSAGTIAREKSREYEDRLTAAMAEAMLMQKDGKTPGEIMKTLLPKYPDVALRLGKQIPKIINTVKEHVD